MSGRFFAEWRRSCGKLRGRGEGLRLIRWERVEKIGQIYKMSIGMRKVLNRDAFVAVT